MNNLKHYTRGLKHELLKATFAGETAMIAALAPSNTGSPLECVKESLTDYALDAAALTLYDTTSIASKVTDALTACTTEDVSPCLAPTLPDLV
jgi:hypothetical protein